MKLYNQYKEWEVTEKNIIIGENVVTTNNITLVIVTGIILCVIVFIIG